MTRLRALEEQPVVTVRGGDGFLSYWRRCERCRHVQGSNLQQLGPSMHLCRRGKSLALVHWPQVS